MSTQRTLYARFTAKEGKGGELADILGELIEIVQREEGLQFYVLNRGVEDPGGAAGRRGETGLPGPGP